MVSQPRTPRHERRLRAGDIELAVTEYEADGPPLLLLHGIGSRGVSWWPVLDRLAMHARPIALDLRGHGASDKPATGYLLPDYAADLAALVDALGLDRPIVLGHSLGALVALEWAKTNHRRAAALILEDPSLRPQPAVLRAFDGWLALNAMPVEQAAAYYRSEHPDWTDEDCRRRAESITAAARGVFAELRTDTEVQLEANDDRIGSLPRIDTPTLLIHGDLDAGSMTVPADVARFAAAVPGIRVVRVPGAPHNIHQERPEAFLDAVIPFLTGSVRPAGT
jgi:pimeloyl-ACP methyl ester carboxylesterase